MNQIIKKIIKFLLKRHRNLINRVKFCKIKDKKLKKVLQNASSGLSINIANNASFCVGSPCFTCEKGCDISIRENAKLSIGEGTFFNSNNIIVARKSIVIGRNCLFGPNVYICDHDHSFDGNKISTDTFTTKPIVIGDNCWIGAGCIILKGAHIGNNVVIGAGTLVTGSIPNNKIVIQKRNTKFIDNPK